MHIHRQADTERGRQMEREIDKEKKGKEGMRGRGWGKERREKLIF